MLRRCAYFVIILASSLVATALLSPAPSKSSSFSAQGRGVLNSQSERPAVQLAKNANLFKAAGQSFFAASRIYTKGIAAFDDTKQIERLRQLIETAESRQHGYNAVQLSAKIKPPKKPTAMTIAEIYEWIDDTPGQHHAIGRYQFIPDTLRRLVKKCKLSANTRFTPRVQDQLADILLIQAGLNKVKKGEMTREAFMTKLAKIWAGLPTPSGKSYYDGYAGNKASISWEAFDNEMAKIFPS